MCTEPVVKLYLIDGTASRWTWEHGGVTDLFEDFPSMSMGICRTHIGRVVG